MVDGLHRRTTAPFTAPGSTRRDARRPLRRCVGRHRRQPGFTTTLGDVTARIDNTAPATATLTDPGTPLAGTVDVTGSATDAGSGIASLDAPVQHRPARRPGPTPASTPARRSPAALGHDRRRRRPLRPARGRTDARRQHADLRRPSRAAASTTRRRRVADRPRLAADRHVHAVRDGDRRRLRRRLGARSSAADRRQRPGRRSAPTTPTPYTCSWNTTALADGSYDLRARATDNAGNQTSTVDRDARLDNTAPTAPTSRPTTAAPRA